MGANSKIEWTDNTFSPWRGCTKVSPACDHCYAEAYGKRFGIAWGPGAKRVRASEAYWRQPLAWDRKAAKAGKPLRVFCASLADVFDEEVEDSWRSDLFSTIGDTPHLIWMLLTKRPNAALRWSRLNSAWPLPNVWLGTTAENQVMLDLRWPLLRETPAVVHFLSLEPLLGHVELPGDFLNRGHRAWCIVGGESGPGARPSHPDWFRSLRDQCTAAGVPFFFKQWGEWAPLADNEVGDPRFTHQFEDGTMMLRIGKKAAGRMLDGREWSEVPT